MDATIVLIRPRRYLHPTKERLRLLPRIGTATSRPGDVYSTAIPFFINKKSIERWVDQKRAAFYSPGIDHAVEDVIVRRIFPIVSKYVIVVYIRIVFPHEPIQYTLGHLCRRPTSALCPCRYGDGIRPHRGPDRRFSEPFQVFHSLQYRTRLARRFHGTACDFS